MTWEYLSTSHLNLLWIEVCGLGGPVRIWQVNSFLFATCFRESVRPFFSLSICFHLIGVYVKSAQFVTANGQWLLYSVKKLWFFCRFIGATNLLKMKKRSARLLKWGTCDSNWLIWLTVKWGGGAQTCQKVTDLLKCHFRYFWGHDRFKREFLAIYLGWNRMFAATWPLFTTLSSSYEWILWRISRATYGGYLIPIPNSRAICRQFPKKCPITCQKMPENAGINAKVRTKPQLLTQNWSMTNSGLPHREHSSNSDNI